MRLEPGWYQWMRLPNQHGGGVAVHPSEADALIESGIPFVGGLRGVIYFVERQAFVDILHFHFVKA